MATSYLLNRGSMIFWRRRLPGRAAKIFGRSHLILSLRTRDPKRARQLSRRLAVHFDEILDAMEQVTTTLTKEQQEAAILQKMKTAKRHFTPLRYLLARGHVDTDIFAGFTFPGTSSASGGAINSRQRLSKLYSGLLGGHPMPIEKRFVGGVR